MRVSERCQPGSSCTGVFGGRPDGPGWFVLVGREGMGQPCCANPESRGVTWRSARSVWGASSGQGAGFGQQQRTISSSEAWLDKGANSCVYSRGDYRVTPPVRVIRTAWQLHNAVCRYCLWAV